ncbi:MAG: type I-B CRISPR-associated protein Cas8b1/Cst1 [Candidatus Odinarchaeota archaeon]
MKHIDITGHFLVDHGQYVLLELCKKDRIDDIVAIDFRNVADRLVDSFNTEIWWKEFRTVFPNGWYNPSAKPIQGSKDTSYYRKISSDFQTAIDKINSQEVSKYRCTFCQKPTGITLSKMSLPFAGGPAFPNFNSGFITGTPVCGHCYFYLMVSPLSFHKIGSSWFLGIQSLNSKIMQIWTNIALESSLRPTKDQAIYTMGYKFRGYQNAYFEEVTRILEREEQLLLTDDRPVDDVRELRDSNILFYFWNNDNRGSKMEANLFPKGLFNFFIELKCWGLKHEFDRVIWAGFYLNTSKITKLKKKSSQKHSEDFEYLDQESQLKLYRESRNRVFTNLLQGRSILPFFINKKRVRVRTSWKVVQLYLAEVIKMSDDRISVIKKLGESIALLLNEVPDRKQERMIVWSLERCSRYQDLVSYLTMIDSICIRLGKDIVVNSEMITSDLFPGILEGEYPKDWQIVHNLLRIVLYEKAPNKVRDIIGAIETEDESVTSE